MKSISRHHYEKRIKDLESEVSNLRDYRRVSYSIFTTISTLVSENKTINQGWILNQYVGLLK